MGLMANGERGGLISRGERLRREASDSGVLTIALAKGRLADQTLELLARAGLEPGEAGERELIRSSPDGRFRFIMAKPSDVPTFVDYGAADLGVCGSDTLMEEDRDLYELLDLGFGRCRLCVCGAPELKGQLGRLNSKRVATKYPNSTRRYFALQHESVEIIKLNGSVELAPLTGLADIIVDIVESGRTLRENGLVVLEEVAPVSARVVVNRVSMKMKKQGVNEVLAALGSSIGTEDA